MERTLGPETLVIADAARPVALAGVMGGEESEVADEHRATCCWSARSSRRSACAPGRAPSALSTDASFRYERGVDPELQPAALRRVVELILAVAGGRAEPVAADLEPRPFARARVELRPARVRQLLGIELGPEEIAALLEPIGFRVEPAGDVLRVEVPGWRPDVEREIDLVEEIARRRGYDSFPEALRPFRPSSVPEDPFVAVERRLRRLFGAWGLLEARTTAFAPAAEERVPLLNPLSAEEGHLRDALLPGLLRRVEHNWAHGVRDVRLFEVATVFLPGDGPGGVREELHVAAVLTGARRPPHWSAPTPSWDLWDLEALLSELGAELRWGEVVPGEGRGGVLADGESFRLRGPGGEARGAGGRVRDDALDAPAWAEPVLALEVTLPVALPQAARAYVALPEHPAVERDLALLVPLARSAAEVEAVLREAAGPLLAEAAPFDLYVGKGIPEDRRSLAWRLRFRAPDRTLTDAEVDPAVERVLDALRERLDVHRR